MIALGWLAGEPSRLARSRQEGTHPTVMLSLVLSEANGAAKHLAPHRHRPFAEFTLSATNVLRMTLFGLIMCLI